MNNFIEKNFRENEKLLFLRDSTMPLNKPMSPYPVSDSNLSIPLQSQRRWIQN